MIAGLLDGITIFSMILLIAGFILIGVELTAPGISVPGIIGTICLIISVILTADTIAEGVAMTIIILAILGIMLGIMLWLLAKGKLVKPIILTNEMNKADGYISSSDLEYLLGKEGVATTDLRPSGIGSFDGVNFDVVSDGQYVVKGTPIIIYKVQGSKLVVKVKSN